MSKAPRWSRPAINALHLLYRAGWRWAAISAHVSAVDGYPRSPCACQRKAGNCGMVDPSRIGGATLAVPDYDADITDMMMMDYSLNRIARELGRQYGRPFTGSFVHKRISRMGCTAAAWRKRSGERRSRGQTGINRKGQGRAAA